MSSVPKSSHSATQAVRMGLDTDTQHGAVVAPIYLSSNFTFAGFNQRRAYDYSRSGNPTRDALAETLASLEQGVGAVITATGMAAVNLCCQLLTGGELIMAPHDCYGGTYRLFDALQRRGQVRTVFVDYGDAAAVQAALLQKPRLIWVETPSNPLLRVTDIAEFAAHARAVGALLAVDNTFMSPAWQTPITLGADIVVHSTTKYLNGHSDVVGGAVIAAQRELHEQLAWWANCTGVTGAPFDSFLTLRGLRSLHARLAVHAANAQRLAKVLATHPKVKQVNYPGLVEHPQYALAARQQRSPGAMMSVELQGGTHAVQRFVEHLQLFSLAESLGGVESLVAHPATMTHSAISDEARARAGITDGLVRLSIGIEDGADLERDVLQALAAIQG